MSTYSKAKWKIYRKKLQQNPCTKCGERRLMQTKALCVRCYGRIMRSKWTPRQWATHRKRCRSWWHDPKNARKAKKIRLTYYLNHKKESLEYQRKYQKKNRRRLQAYYRRYYRQNRKRLQAYQHKYYRRAVMANA